MDWAILFENLISWQACLLAAVGLGFLGLERHLKRIQKQNAEILAKLSIQNVPN